MELLYREINVLSPDPRVCGAVVDQALELLQTLTTRLPDALPRLREWESKFTDKRRVFQTLLQDAIRNHALVRGVVLDHALLRLTRTHVAVLLL